MKKNYSEEDLLQVIWQIKTMGLIPKVSRGKERTVVGVIGDTRKISKPGLERMSQIESITPVLKPFKLASREFHPDDSVINVNGVRIGGKEFTVIAGPCTIESEEQMRTAAEGVKKAGAKILRGSAYKPRSSPYSFQGMGKDGLKILRKIANEFNLNTDSELPKILEG